MNSKDIHSAGDISISLGILAWNEESNIARTIESIFKQSIFDRWNHLFEKIEIICVANGCTDDTAKVARKALTLDYPKCHVDVISLEQPGKANAWNNYIHRFSDQTANIVFLLDADIELLHPDTLYNMASTMYLDDEALAVTDTPIKHLEFKSNKSIFDQISLFLSRITQGSSAQITGQLYAMKGEFIRSIWMPVNYKTFQDDGFLKQVVVTRGFRYEPDARSVKKAPDASHVFEAYTGVRDIFNNQVRQATNVVILGFIIDELKTLKKRNKRADLGEIIYSLNISDNCWVSKIINNKINECGYFVVSPFYFFARLRKFKIVKGVYQKLLAAPVITTGFFVDLLVYSIANQKIKNLSYDDVWKDTKNKHI
jgi:glycosyltransferase involved in cell wall biosynthesis